MAVRTAPEPGGLTYNMLIETLAAVATKGRIVGVDIVEINPMNDGNGGEDVLLDSFRIPLGHPRIPSMKLPLRFPMWPTARSY